MKILNLYAGIGVAYRGLCVVDDVLKEYKVKGYLPLKIKEQ